MANFLLFHGWVVFLCVWVCVCVCVCLCVCVCVCITSSLSTHLLADTLVVFISWLLCVYHIIFIHSSLGGHFDCFHILAVVNSAAMNIGVHVSFQSNVFICFGHIPRSRITESYIALFLVFEESPYCFPQQLHQFASPLTVHKSFLSFMSLPEFICGLFDASHSDRREALARCGLDISSLLCLCSFLWSYSVVVLSTI